MRVWEQPERRYTTDRRGCGWARMFAACAVLWTSAAWADPPHAPTGREIWAGADVSQNVWLLYSGVTIAPWSGIYDPGLRVRAAGAFGGYSYSDRVANEDPDGPVRRPVRFHAQTYVSDILIGYLARFGELTAKAFIGASMIGHDISPTDDETVAIGTEVGLKGVLELWLNIGERGWGSLDLSWSEAHETRSARARLGYRIQPELSIGLEGGINLDAQGVCRIDGPGASGCKAMDETRSDPAELLDYVRIGVFVRYEWGVSEASLSAGAWGNSWQQDGQDFAPYITVNWLTQF